MSTRDPAPGALETIRAFVNTLDVESGEDAIAAPETLRAFLSDHGLIHAGAAVDDDDVARVRDVREGLRAMLLAHHHDEPVDGAAVGRLNASAGDGGLVLRFREDGSSELTPRSDGVDAAIGRLLAIVFGAMQQGTWDRLKICKRDSCLWAFYDRSRNHSSRWCSMAVCGNREKASAYRRRQAGE